MSALKRGRNVVAVAKQILKRRRKLCILIKIDIENTYNTEPWDGILEELKKKRVAPYLYNMFASYFENLLFISESHNDE